MRNMNKLVDLLIIDPQKDFVEKYGSLSVPGAKEDMQRLSFFVENNLTRFNNIRVSLDQHHPVHIAHANYWLNSNGDMPGDYTQITYKDVVSCKWHTRNPVLQTHAVAYLEALEKAGKTHRIWPQHCLIGSVGATVEENLFNALLKWEEQFEMVDYVSKGSNPHVEHFSIVKAEVEYPGDPGTQLNSGFISDFAEADVLLVTGEALLHCVRSSFFDIVNGFADPNTVKKMVFLKDCSSPVPLPNPGYQQMADDFYKEMEAKGVLVTTTDKYQF